MACSVLIQPVLFPDWYDLTDYWRSSNEGFCIVCEVSVCFGHTLTVFIFVFEYTLYGDIQSI